MLCAGSDPELTDSCRNTECFSHGIDTIWTVEGSALMQRCQIACTYPVAAIPCIALCLVYAQQNASKPSHLRNADQRWCLVDLTAQKSDTAVSAPPVD